MPFVLIIGVLAGLGLDLTIDRFRGWGTILAAAVIAAGTIDGFMVSTPNLHYVLESPLGKVESQPTFRQYLGEFYSDDMFKHTLSNEGAVQCTATLPIPIRVRGYNQTGYRGKQYFLGAGSVSILRWSPNLLSYKVSAPVSDLLVSNQNYDPSWRLVSGVGTVVADHGLLAIQLPAGTQRLELKYVDTRFMLGALITMLAIAISGFIVRRERRKV